MGQNYDNITEFTPVFNKETGSFEVAADGELPEVRANKASVYLGNREGKKIFHMMKGAGRPISELTGAVNRNTVFHSDLPYLLTEEVEFPMQADPAPLNKMQIPVGIGSQLDQHRQWYQHNWELSSSLKEKLSKYVHLLYVEDADGSCYGLPTTPITLSSAFEEGNTLFLSNVLGLGDLTQGVYTFVAFTPYPDVSGGVLLETHFGYKPGSSTHLTFYQSPYRPKPAKIRILFTNFRYTADSVTYESRLTGAVNDIQLRKSLFKINDLDLATQTIGTFRSTLKAGATNVRNTVNKAVPSLYDTNNILASQQVMSNYITLVGGQGAKNWEWDLSQGTIDADVQGKHVNIFSAEEDLDGLLFAASAPIRVQVAAWRVWLTLAVTSTNAKRGSIDIPNFDGTQRQYLLMYTPSAKRPHVLNVVNYPGVVSDTKGMLADIVTLEEGALIPLLVSLTAPLNFGLKGMTGGNYYTIWSWLKVVGSTLEVWGAAWCLQDGRQYFEGWLDFPAYDVLLYPIGVH